MLCNTGIAQITERERPKEWDQLVPGARFIDRFLPMKGKVLSSDTWGSADVLPRYIDNGIEDRIWSYWGGNIQKGENGLYHLFVCGWLESSPKGHGEWPNSYIFNAVSDNPVGPFKARNMIGAGHNPEVFRLNDGRYVLYVINGRYVTDDLNGKWEYGKFDFDPRGRKIIEGLSNLSFASREDGSYIMVCRGGGIWISRDGLSTYRQITDKRVYPDVDGRFEDPVIWKDHIQYHLIVNDWYGRIAFYLRSRDGIKWVVDPGEAYIPGIARHEDGQSEEWFKYERIKMYQDKYGRAIQANFAVIDTLKYEDKPFDTHSSKNIAIPLNPGLLLTIPDNTPITHRTKTIRVRIEAEEGFNPQTDIDIESLRFGASEEVNYGRGCVPLKTENEGNALTVTFNGKGNGITEDEFAPKLIGKYKNGKMLYGYVRLPYINYVEPLLSACAPSFQQTDRGWNCEIEVENFGQVASQNASLKLERTINGKKMTVASGNIPALQPYEKTTVTLACKKGNEEIESAGITVAIHSGKKILSTLELKKEK
ncbi:MAG: glycoside hydrolase family protein [Tannerella sp.]|nr:glycoside hydrolase family protein [Tannerella sp.]